MAAALAVGSALAGVRPAAMEKLPLGSVRAEGWLLKQLELQRDGLTGHAEELYDDIGKSDWLTGKHVGRDYAWERGPYYAKGLVTLALTLDDPSLKLKAKRWVDALIASQRENGDFGPKNDNWWANMIALHLMRDWCAATGDARVIPFLGRYFAYQLKRLKEHPLSADSYWAVARGGDNLEVVLWLYDRTGNEDLLGLAELIAKQSADWTDYYFRGGDSDFPYGFRSHIVNFMQGLKLPALKWRLGGDVRDRGAYAAAFAADGWAMRAYGRVDRMLNGTEPLSSRSAGEGTELCAVAERILSCQEVIAAVGELRAADDLESVAYNTLPGELGDDGKGMRYYTLLNQPVCAVKSCMGYANNGEGGSIVPGPDAGYGCCRSNFHFAWPKFVQSMWMKKDGGLAAVAYGPCRVETELGGKRIVIRMVTDYPFADKVTIRVEEGGGRFPVFARIPGWAKCADAGRFRKFEREWKEGDEITLEFPCDIAMEKGINGSVALKRGALVYSLGLDAEVKELAVATNRIAFPTREYHPKSRWNYAIVVRDYGAPEAKYRPSGALDGNVFRHGNSPCSLTVKAVTTDYGGWGTRRAEGHFDALAIEPPPSPVRRSDCGGEVKELKFVPTGTTQIRITLFPWTTALLPDS